MPEETKPLRGTPPARNNTRLRSGRRRGGPRATEGYGSARQNSGRRAPVPPPPPDEDLVLVRFKGCRKSYYHNRRGLELKVGQYCLVEADRGRDLGRITYLGAGRPEWWSVAAQQGVLQLADVSDLERLHRNRADEWDFWDICQEKILARQLKMNLVTVERQFDHRKITFYFTAEKRVDFRELVRDLAAVFRTRIELRQIGVRDEARMKGGLGICGREFCCASYLHDFVPVTLKMAKVQQLPLNPGKLSGPCGRLRCCLTYENEQYRDSRRRLPKVGSRVITSRGTGTVRKVDLLQGNLTVDHGDPGGPSDWPAADVTWGDACELPAPGASEPKADYIRRPPGEGAGNGSH